MSDSHDSFVETTTTSWLTRIKNALFAVVLGVGLFLGSFYLLSWNEGRALDEAQVLHRAREIYVRTDPATVDPQKEGKLVHLSGPLKTDDAIKDGLFGVQVSALKLKRIVKFYQWEETQKSTSHKNMGGSETTETTYNYRRVWSDKLIDSSRFRQSEGHENRIEFPFRSTEMVAQNVTMKAFQISSPFIAPLTAYQAVPLTAETYERLSPEIKGKLTLYQGGYASGNPEAPQIGDVRITYEAVPLAQVSLMGQQKGSLLGVYAMDKGEIHLVEEGVVDPEEMIRRAESKNAMITWGLRLLGFGVMGVGLFLVLRPLAVLGDILPFLGSFLGYGLGFVSFVLALALSLITIAVAWIAVRPVLAFTVLAMGIASLCLFFLKKKPQSASIEKSWGAPPSREYPVKVDARSDPP